MTRESEKWIVDVRFITDKPEEWSPYENESAPKCDHCEMKPSVYWVEEFAMGLCQSCRDDLKKDCFKEKVDGKENGNKNK